MVCVASARIAPCAHRAPAAGGEHSARPQGGSGARDIGISTSGTTGVGSMGFRDNGSLVPGVPGKMAQRLSGLRNMAYLTIYYIFFLLCNI